MKDSVVTFTGKIPDISTPISLEYAAAAPADRHSTFTGSGLPFPNAKQAFEDTPNRGSVKTDKFGHFSITLKSPNAYYIGLGSTYVPPTLYVSWITIHNESKHESFLISKGIPFRKLTYPWQRTDASFYGSIRHLPVRSQEQILRDSAYPNEEPENFWGLKPPV